MKNTTKQRLTPDEIALLREIARWRRNNGCDLIFQLADVLRLADGRAFTWLRPGSHAVCMKIGVTQDYASGGPFTWHRVVSITQGVDLLVALSYLPPRFSSAYRAGWRAATVWHTGDGQGRLFRELFHDPANISFPASDLAW